MISQHIQCSNLINSDVVWVPVSSETQVEAQIILDPDDLPDYFSFLMTMHRRSEPREVQLLRKKIKIFISDDDVLYCKNKEQLQIILPHAIMEAVYRAVFR